jgi:translation initiation factor IF-2
MPNIGTRLFKLASQINIGKETIVDFLQARGFKIENKATTTLTDEMTELVLDNFQKELGAAERQRAKSAQAAAAKAEAKAEKAAEELHMRESSAHAESELHLTESTAEQQSAHDSAASGDEQKPASIQPDIKGDATKPTAKKKQTDTGIAVGTVIALDELQPTRKATRSKKQSSVETSETPALENAPSSDTKRKSTSKSKKTSAQDESPVAPELLHQTETLVSTESSAAPTLVVSDPDKHGEEYGEQSMPTGVESRVEALATEALKLSQETASASTEESVEQKDVGGFAADTPHRITLADHHEADYAEEGEHDLHEEHDVHADGTKKKRRKKIGEVEYASIENDTANFGNYASAIPKPNLTILGKIELEQRGSGRGKDSARGDRDSRERSKSTDKGAIKVKGMPAKVALQRDEVIGKRGGALGSKKKRKKGKREQVSAEEVERAIRRTLAGQDDILAIRSRLRRTRRAERAEQEERDAELRELESSILHVTEFITVAELSNMMGVGTNEVIMKCMGLGLMVSINQRLDKDTITLIADDFGFTVEFEDVFAEEDLEDVEEDEAVLTARAPIVTVMGHVDHGKTSLLDYIRNTSVATGESGGITQHIGAYSVKMNNNKFITFLDTPGHQAFTAMRARGAQVTDIVVLVVAADDNVMPQTIEAISHARAANVPMIVAINKIDKPDANPDRIRQQLADQNVLVEEWGGKYQSVEISAKKGLNIDSLLEKILLEAELLNLRANPNRAARGTVVEAKIDKGKGPVATVIVQKGTLHVGDPFICGVFAGRVRAMLDEQGNRVEQAIPSTPVQLLGLDGVPQAGDTLVVMKSESAAKELANQRQQIKREQDFKQIRHVTLDDLAASIESGGTRELKIILKGDTGGSVEALADSLQKLSTPEVSVSIIYRAVGAITESDVMLAAASDAVIIGFHVRPSPQIAKLAENEGVDIRLYRIIYDCINEVRLALEGMLRPEVKEEISGVAEIREVFKISKLGNIAGCYMLEGKINRNDTVRVLRDGFEVFSNGKISSLKRMKDDVREVDAGFECGIAIEGFNDIKVGDFIEAIRRTEIKRKL